MIYQLRRHPFPVAATFEFSLVLTFAFPAPILEPLLPPGLELDRFEDCGFVAIALVQTRELRPKGMPTILGSDFFLSGYRIFSRFRRPSDGRNLRGLRILRSDTDSGLMAFAGNLFTHYHYEKAKVHWTRRDNRLIVEVATPQGLADLEVSADLGTVVEAPPSASPFPDLKTARLFAGPLPFTFDYEKQTHWIVVIEGVRENWTPKPVAVEVRKASFFDREPFAGQPLILANAFFLESVPYAWRKGRLEKL